MPRTSPESTHRVPTRRRWSPARSGATSSPTRSSYGSTRRWHSAWPTSCCAMRPRRRTWRRKRSCGHTERSITSALAERFEREAPVSREPSPEALALDRERRDGVLAGLARLRPDERLVLELRYFLDLGEAEMAATLGCARGTVKSRVHRALARLRPL